MLSKDDFTELFETQVRGTIATAFMFSGVSPGSYWPMIRGEQEVTMRDLADIGYVTGLKLNLQLTPHAEDES